MVYSLIMKDGEFLDSSGEIFFGENMVSFVFRDGDSLSELQPMLERRRGARKT